MQPSSLSRPLGSALGSCELVTVVPVGGPVSLKRAELKQAALGYNRRRDDALARCDSDELSHLNARLILVERGLLDPAGIPGRPWYRHLIYAPKYTYAPEVLPGVAEAVDGGDAAHVAAQSARLSAALARAAAALR